MKILVLYATTDVNIRKTIRDHLYSFKNYVTDAKFHYVNAHLPLPWYLPLAKYDGIIIHYTLLAYRWKEPLRSKILKHIRQIKKMDCIKVAIPQDEYYQSDFLCQFFKDFNVETVFTCASPIDYENLYPKEKSGLKHYITTLTGFVDDVSLEKINKFKKENSVRNIDVGYRARSLPYWVGRFSQLKRELAEKFQNEAANAELILDISTKDKDVFFGDEWLKFLLRCRTMLGSLGGASLHDPKGEICDKVEKWIHDHPNATFDETEEACFKGQDYNLSLFALSPRHFECAMTKTCQVLVEGDYQGVFLPNTHFIEIKRDFSNLEEVIKKIQDLALCEKIADAAYRDVVLSEKYTYKTFANNIVDHIRYESGQSSDRIFNNLIFTLISKLLFLRSYWIKGRVFGRRCQNFLLRKLSTF